MSSILALSDAIEAMFPEGTLFEAVKPNENGQYVESAFPWTVARVQIPNTLSRSMAGTRHAQSVRITVTIAGITFTSVRVIVDKLDPILEGARPTAVGWSLSPVRMLNARDIVEDETITLTTANRHPVYTVLEYQLTAARN
ncbi:hypothetical protein KTJ89_11275 [Brevibacterium sediminis]|uniref:hypothetical protein n=1 Tax=Brevibacterium sediminis TaxID=1857024 RepID=UPI0021751768|nr:hypothetical protein [Brevibacterium sediminis]MCS4593562.1 hypothetical protein [Brevibacterium sediminis]